MPPTCPRYLIVALLDLCSTMLALRSTRYLCLLSDATYCGPVCGLTLPATCGHLWAVYMWPLCLLPVDCQLGPILPICGFSSLSTEEKEAHRPVNCLLLVPWLFIWSKIRPVVISDRYPLPKIRSTVV
ncbi:hypothetical protein O6H91_16G008200 [Diphasiastrum complanatum]|uniref:Uncharacterized protein n=1 Tax=Diphasiastrum complanatum TaxID=34168 RepID=A0ACC2BAN0_DIPCM|nr:hypothetical protein O6H91_16G008200 [Diphasiastrum complanatum]